MYEKGVTSPISSSSPELWRDYINFSIQRGKMGNVSKLYRRAIESVQVCHLPTEWECTNK